MDSVMEQDYPHIEYIVLDGASTDGSVEQIKAQEKVMSSQDFREKHPLFSFKFISEPDHGMYEAINKGMMMATGDIVGLVHSDDFLYDKDVISAIVKTFEDTGADFVYGNGIFVDPKDVRKIVRRWWSGPYHKWKVPLGWLPLHPTCYIRREVMMKEGLYDESYQIAADSEFLVRYLYKTKLKVVYLNRLFVRMRMGGLSTDRKKRKLMWDEDLRLYRTHGFAPLPTKLMKMMWKVPQFITAKIS